MLIAIPYFNGATDYDNLAAAIKKQGVCLGHHAIVISAGADIEGATAFAAKLEETFRSVTHKHVELGDRQFTPVNAANAMFRKAVEMAASYRSGGDEVQNPPVLLFDPTFRPTKSGWLDLIQMEYYKNDKPLVMGVWNEIADGSKVTDGPTVFSPEFAAASGLLYFIPDNTHWRFYLRWEIGNVIRRCELVGQGAGSVVKHKP